MIFKKNGLFWKRRKNMKNAILAISEKKEILKQIRKELAEKYEVITFNNLLDAIDMVRESDFDLILLDNALEGISVGEAKKKLTSIGKDFITVALVDEINEAETKELEKFTSILDIPDMSKDEIEKYILKFSKDNNIKVDEKDIGEVAISLKGLTKLEIDHVLNMIIESKNNISISGRDIIIKEKGQIIKKSSILEIIDFKEKIEDIGGLEGLKEWLKSKAQVFRRLDEAKKFGVDTPKGVLLVNLGSPDSFEVKDIKRYLKEFLSC